MQLCMVLRGGRGDWRQSTESSSTKIDMVGGATYPQTGVIVSTLGTVLVYEAGRFIYLSERGSIFHVLFYNNNI
jgi:hypothetical protein